MRILARAQASRARSADRPGTDTVGDNFLALAAKENIDCSACPRVPGVLTSISAITIDNHGERAIANFRDERLSQTKPDDAGALVRDADAVLADNRYPAFVREVLLAARARRIPTVLDADEPRHDSDDLLGIASHVVFSAEGLRATAGTDSLGRGLIDVAKRTDIVSGRDRWAQRCAVARRRRVASVSGIPVDVVDTLGAGDTFHGAFTLMLAEGADIRTAVRFSAAAAALKCTNRDGPGSSARRAALRSRHFWQKN